ncbi:uncharacterized protein [Nicotiana sylvestris]|uniref:uncharacterized protein n=1 Tax=Nicotiana sylvestris TaxID=4096 RepID=UPI00388C501A
MASIHDNVDHTTTSNSGGFVTFTLDPSHPLYVRPSDSPGIQLVSIPFNGTGFVLWRNSMLTSISAKNKLGILDGRVAQPTPNSPYFPYWERCNDMVKSWVINSISREIATSVMCFKTAKELRKLWDELNSSYVVPTCSCGALPKFIEDQQLFQFLNGLSESYSTVKSTIMMMSPLPPISKVYPILQQDESQRETPHAPSFTGDSASFLASPNSFNNTNKNFTQRINFDSKRNANSVSCKYCKKTGHTVDKCYRLHGFPADFSSPRTRSQHLVSRLKFLMSLLLAFLMLPPLIIQLMVSPRSNTNFS